MTSAHRLTPPGGERPLTQGETLLVRAVFGDAIDPAPVRLKRRRFLPLQPPGTVMAPMGHLHFHPACPHWHENFAQAPLAAQGLFVHEMVHVWQAQCKGRWWLPLMRHPFCRYAYRFEPGKPFERYGIEQQAEIVRHAFLAARRAPAPGAPPLDQLRSVLPF